MAAGGDGTINEVVEGMVHSDVPLAILPGGTANVLATEMKLGGRLDRAAERLEECLPQRVPLGRLACDGGRVVRHFLLMAGIGLDAHIVNHVDTALKARIGKLAYWVAGWSLLGKRLAQFHVELNGRRGVLFRTDQQGPQLRRRFRNCPQRDPVGRGIRGGAVRGPHHPAAT